MSIQSIRRSVHHALFPLKFENKKIEALQHFIAQNESNTEYWYTGGLLNEFVNIIKNFDQNDIQDFFNNIHLWDSYHLVIIADKLLDNNVKSSVKCDLGQVYCRIFCKYEMFDPYYLIDNLEIAVTMYHSKLDINILVDLTAKLQLLFQSKQITRQQFEYNLSFINKLRNEL